MLWYLARCRSLPLGCSTRHWWDFATASYVRRISFGRSRNLNGSLSKVTLMAVDGWNRLRANQGSPTGICGLQPRGCKQ